MSWPAGRRRASGGGWILLLLGVRLVSLAADFPAHLEDSYYSLTIARNLAAGLGPTAGGGEWTNGFQPLPVLLAMPAYWLFDPGGPAALLAVHLLALGLEIAAAWFLAAFAAERFGPPARRWTMVLWITSPYLASVLRWSFETSVVVAALALALWWGNRVLAAPPGNGLIGLGALLGLACLARVDGAFFALGLAGVVLAGPGRRFSAASWRRAAAAAAVFVLVQAPWWLFGALAAGGAIPVSGPATRLLALAQAPAVMDALEAGRVYPPALAGTAVGGAPLPFLLEHLRRSLVYLLGSVPPLSLLRGWRPVSWYDVGQHTGLLPALAGWPALLAMLGLLGLGLAALRRRLAGGPLPAVAIFLAGLVLAYSFVMLGQWNFFRYYAPPVALLVPFLGAGWAALEGRRRWARRASWLLIAALAASFAAQDANRFERFPFRFTLATDNHRLAGWLADHLPADAVIGAWESGTIGYFAPRQVVNLDGVVNRQAYEALRERRIDRYLRERGIDYMVIRDWQIQPLLAAHSGGAGLRFEPVAEIGGLQVFRIAPPAGAQGEGNRWPG